MLKKIIERGNFKDAKYDKTDLFHYIGISRLDILFNKKKND